MCSYIGSLAGRRRKGAHSRAVRAIIFICVCAVVVPAPVFAQNPNRGSARPVQPSNPQPPGPDVQELELAAVQAAATGGDMGALRGYLRNPDINIQTAAFNALAARDTADALKDMVDVVNDSSAPGRLQALQLLQGSALTDESTMTNALHEAAGANDNAVSGYAVDALGRMEHPDETPVLNSSPGEQFSADKGSTENAPPAVDTAPSDVAASGEDKQKEAASSPNGDNSSKHPDTASESPEQETKPSVDDLAARFRDTSLPVAERLHALQLVDASNGDEWSVTAVLRDALSDAQPLLRACAVQALARRGNAGSAPAMDAMRDALHNSDRSLRLLVVQSLGHTDVAMPLLREALSDSDKEVSAAASSLLDSAAGPSPVAEKQQ